MPDKHDAVNVEFVKHIAQVRNPIRHAVAFFCDIRLAIATPRHCKNMETVDEARTQFAINVSRVSQACERQQWLPSPPQVQVMKIRAIPYLNHHAFCRAARLRARLRAESKRQHRRDQPDADAAEHANMERFMHSVNPRTIRRL